LEGKKVVGFHRLLHANWRIFSAPNLKGVCHTRAMAGRKRISVAKVRARIHALRGAVKMSRGGKSFTEALANSKRDDKYLEEKKSQRLAALGK
jgi:hypothetical protein